MSNKTRLITLLVAAFVLLLPVLLLAGTIQLPQTGQTKCYDSAGTEITCAGTGQDGDIQAGVAWPNPRFTVNGDCVTDNLTGLMWAKNGNLSNGTRTWQEALDFVASLNSSGGLCGYSDWCLPNINELESLVNADVSNLASWLNTQGFNNVQSNLYWSSTTAAWQTAYKWAILMEVGYIASGAWQGNNNYIWPVRSCRSGGVVSLPQTGQKTSYRFGDDGDLQLGVAWPNPRFHDNGDETVTDNLTGLVWLKDANCIKTKYSSFDNDWVFGDGSVTWQHALDFLSGINNGTYSNCSGGYTDWRLPNRKEFHSLIDCSNYNPVLPTGHPFTNVQSDGYWSSTSYALVTNHAWLPYMWNGDVPMVIKDYYSSTYNSYVWPVRGVSTLKLDFPLPGYTPYTVNISSILDHSGPFYNEAGHINNVIIAYTGEEARCEYGAEEYLGRGRYRYYTEGTKELECICNNSNRSGTWGYMKADQSEISIPGQGKYLWYDGHPGYDFLPSNNNYEIIAPADGILCISTNITSKPQKGNTLWRNTNKCPYGNDPINGTKHKATSWDGWHTFYIVHNIEDYTTWYLHSDYLDPAIQNNILNNGYAEVTRGQTIARVGNYGTGGYHLHFEVRKGDRTIIDPYGWGTDPILWNNNIYTISGTVSWCGSPSQGVTINLSSGSLSKTTTTDSNGNYSFPGLTNGTYTVTVVGYGSKTVTVNGADVKDVNCWGCGDDWYF